MSPPLFIRMLLSNNPINVFIGSAIHLVVALATKLSIFLLFVGITLLLYNVVWGVLDSCTYLTTKTGQAQRESEIRLECERYRAAAFGDTGNKIVDFPVNNVQ